MFSKVVEISYSVAVQHARKARNSTMSRFVAKGFNLIRKSVLLFSNPKVKMIVGDYPLYMHLSHELPLNMAYHPYYDTALTRICATMKNLSGNLIMIDVGANVGDTISLISQSISGSFLAIEAEDAFYRLLLENVKELGKKNLVVPLKMICDEKTSEKVYVNFTSSKGTSNLEQICNSFSGVEMESKSLDDIVAENTFFASCNILKIDTDGYDYKVLRGAGKLLENAKPAIFFELYPALLRRVGEEPLSIFLFLQEKGYSRALLYDNVGYPVIFINLAEIIVLEQLVDYIEHKKSYFDVLIFHDSAGNAFEEFQLQEKNTVI